VAGVLHDPHLRSEDTYEDTAFSNLLSERMQKMFLRKRGLKFWIPNFNRRSCSAHAADEDDADLLTKRREFLSSSSRIDEQKPCKLINPCPTRVTIDHDYLLIHRREEKMATLIGAINTFCQQKRYLRQHYLDIQSMVVRDHLHGRAKRRFLDRKI
jgi:hypothetical protein